MLNGRDPASIPIHDVTDASPPRLIINTLALKGVSEPWSVPPDLLRRAMTVVDESGVHVRVWIRAGNQAGGHLHTRLWISSGRHCSVSSELRIRGRLDGYWADHLDTTLGHIVREGDDESGSTSRTSPSSALPASASS